VDPDNRRPVDFAARQAALDSLAPWLDDPRPGETGRAALVSELLDAWPDGRIKLYLTARLLRARRHDPSVFLDGAYIPLQVDVPVPGGALAFARVHGPRAIVVLVPRLVATLTGVARAYPLGRDCWRDSRALLPPDLAGRTFRNLLTGERLLPTAAAPGAWLPLAAVFERCPVGVLESLEARDG